MSESRMPSGSGREPERSPPERREPAIPESESRPPAELEPARPPARRDEAAPGPRLLAMWERMSRYPGGRWLFSRLLDRRVPYTGTIRAHVLALAPGYVCLRMRDRRRVRNHLGSLHAAALVNLGELATGLAILTALPPGVRGIPTSISAEYVKKARGQLIAECRRSRLERIDSATEVECTAELRDGSGDIVARVTARWRLRPSLARST